MPTYRIIETVHEMHEIDADTPALALAAYLNDGAGTLIHANVQERWIEDMEGVIHDG